MKGIKVGGLLGLLLAAIIGGASLNALSEPTQATLDADLSTLREKMTAARDESSRYDGGLIKSLIDTRIEILTNTEAMLEQKRAALIRFINLDYTIDGKSVPALSEDAMQDLTADIKAAKAEIASAEVEASRYSGGLLRIMAETKVTTERLKLSMLELRFLSAKWGVPLYDLAASSSTEGKSDRQNIVPDDGAL